MKRGLLADPVFLAGSLMLELKSASTQTIVAVITTDSQSMNQFSDNISISAARGSRRLSLLSALLLLPLGG